MAEDTSEYGRLVELIDGIEKDSKKPESGFIDLSEIVNAAAVPAHGTYAAALQLIGEVESGGRRMREQPMQIPTQQAPEQHLITTGVTQTPFKQGEVPKPQKEKKPFALFPQKQAQEAQPVAQKQTEEMRKQKTAMELSAIMGKLQSVRPSIPEFKRRKLNVKDLVLPNLSIADQISELERIIEGLNEHVFDGDHMEIVSQEVFGLQQVIADQRKKAKGKREAQSPLEQSLIDVRDQRLGDAASLLQQSGAK